jgi:hypothetical protein
MVNNIKTNEGVRKWTGFISNGAVLASNYTASDGRVLGQ